jgi:hypothetical protein
MVGLGNELMETGFYDYAAFVKLVIAALEAAGVDYLIGGAVAVWAWGDIPLEAVGRLSDELEERGMLVPADIILDIILDDRSDLPINAIHRQSGYKAELFPIRPNDDLRQSALSRRVLIDLGPQLGKIYLHTPEDLILYKLWYYGQSRQTKHLRDITSIVLASGDELDTAYIESWSERKGTNTLWQEMLARIQS